MVLRKISGLLLVFLMLVSTMSGVFGATDVKGLTTKNGVFKDTNSHLGAMAMDEWATNGVIKGHNGLFRPNDGITRGEMAVILDNMMDYQEIAVNRYTDLEKGQFYTEALLKLIAAGIIAGDKNTVGPKEQITHEEVTRMLATALGKDLDANKVLSQSIITRAETVMLIDSMIQAYFTKAGTYTDNVAGTVVVKVPGVILKGVTMDHLVVAEGVGEGDLTLDTVTVLGDTIVRGGGEHSINILGTSHITTIKIEKAKGKISILIATGNKVQRLLVAKGEEIIISGAVGTLTIASSNMRVFTNNGTIGHAIITGSNTDLMVNSQSIIELITTELTGTDTHIRTILGGLVRSIDANARIMVDGFGTIANVVLRKGADRSTITTPNTQTIVDGGVLGVTGGGGKSIVSGDRGTNNNEGNDLVSPVREEASVGGNVNNTPRLKKSVTPVITQDLSDVNTVLNSSVTLDATATTTDGGVITYTWYKATASDKTGATELNGETNPTYAPPVDQIGNSYYYCVITNTKSGKVATASSSVSKVSVTYTGVTSLSNTPVIGLLATEVDLTGISVNPDASFKTIIWTVKDSGTTGIATGDLATGKFTPLAAGTLVLTATVTNGASFNTDYTQDVTIVLTEFVFDPVTGIISGYYDIAVTEVVIPLMIGHFNVNELDNVIFEQCTQLRKATVPQTIRGEAPVGFVVVNGSWIKKDK